MQQNLLWNSSKYLHNCTKQLQYFVFVICEHLLQTQMQICVSLYLTRIFTICGNAAWHQFKEEVSGVQSINSSWRRWQKVPDSHRKSLFVKVHLPFSLNYLARGHRCCCCLVDTNWPKVKRAFTMRQKVEGSENEAGQTETRVKITMRWKAWRYYVWRQLHEMQKK